MFFFSFLLLFFPALVQRWAQLVNMREKKRNCKNYLMDLVHVCIIHNKWIECWIQKTNKEKKKTTLQDTHYYFRLCSSLLSVVLFGANFKWNFCNYRRTCSPVETTLKCAHFCHFSAINSLEWINVPVFGLFYSFIRLVLVGIFFFSHLILMSPELTEQICCLVKP